MKRLSNGGGEGGFLWTPFQKLISRRVVQLLPTQATKTGVGQPVCTYVQDVVYPILTKSKPG